MLQQILKIALLVAPLALAVKDAQAFDSGGLGAGCGGGIGSSYGCGGYIGSSYSYNTFGNSSFAGVPSGYARRGYSGWELSRSIRKLSAQATRSAGTPVVLQTQPTPHGILLTVSVPADTKLFINGQPTTSTGEVRQFWADFLNPGTVYRYRLRAEFASGGEPVIEERTVPLAVGKNVAVAFSRGPRPQVAEVSATAVALE